MKTKSEKQNNLSPYQANTIDLTTVDSRVEDVYLIDKRLLDVLLRRVTKGSIDDIKEDIIQVVNQADNKEELFSALDEYIYLDQIVQLATPVIEEPVIVEKYPTEEKVWNND